MKTFFNVLRVNVFKGAKCTEIYCKCVCAVDNLNAIVWERQWIRWTTFMLLATY